MTLEISRPRLKAFFAYALLTLAAAAWLLPMIPRPEYQVPFMAAVFLSLVVPSVLVFDKRVNPIEPIYWFALMYLILVPGAYFFIFTNFETSRHILIETIGDRSRWLTVALLYSSISFVATAVGYFLVRRPGSPAPICYEPKDQLPEGLVYLAIAASLAIAGWNFIHVASQFPDGIVGYLQQAGFRSKRLELFESSVTTVGYNLAYSAVLIWIFALRRRPKVSRTEGILFGLALLGSLLISGSQARIFQTISYLLIVASLFYLTSASPNKGRYFFLGVPAFLVMGILLYVVRVISMLLLNRPGLLNDLDYFEVARLGGVSLLQLTFGKGYVPDVSAMMSLLAFWDLDNMQYGKTLLSWTHGLSDQSPFRPVVQLTRGWYDTVGGVPPTVLGEMYVNFHFLGAVVAMFLIGALMAVFYNYYLKTRSFWVTATFVAIVLKFFFIWPKGETANLTGVIYIILPVWATVLFIRGIVALAGPALQAVAADRATLSNAQHQSTS
jgi:oligosaccharide repeat unit polymerase